jgi:hypothetical protein
MRRTATTVHGLHESVVRLALVRRGGSRKVSILGSFWAQYPISYAIYDTW